MPARPHGAVLALLCAVLTALPVASALGLGEVGGYRMFTRLTRVRLELHAVDATGHTSAVTFEELAPHLGRDARRVLRPAFGPGTVGDVSVGSIRAAAPALAELACTLDRARARVEVHVVLQGDAGVTAEDTVRSCLR